MSILKNAFVKRWAKKKTNKMGDNLQANIQQRTKDMIMSEDTPEVIGFIGDKIEQDIDRRINRRVTNAKLRAKNVGKKALIGSGLVAAGVGAGYGINKIINNRKEKQRLEREYSGQASQNVLNLPTPRSLPPMPEPQYMRSSFREMA